MLKHVGYNRYIDRKLSARQGHLFHNNIRECCKLVQFQPSFVNVFNVIFEGK